MNHPSNPPNSLTAYQSVELPSRAPLLSRTGWSFFMLALIAVCAVAPLLNLWLPQSSPYHMSTYAVALQNPFHESHNQCVLMSDCWLGIQQQ